LEAGKPLGYEEQDGIELHRSLQSEAGRELIEIKAKCLRKIKLAMFEPDMDIR
jgi:hypothetical protein